MKKETITKLSVLLRLIHEKVQNLEGYEIHAQINNNKVSESGLVKRRDFPIDLLLEARHLIDKEKEGKV